MNELEVPKPEGTPPPRKPSRAHVVGRIAASLLGGYAFVWGFTTLGIALSVTAGMPYGQSEMLFHMLAILVFLVVLLWAFGAASLSRVWTVLAGGGAVMAGAAWLLSRGLV